MNSLAEVLPPVHLLPLQESCDHLDATSNQASKGLPRPLQVNCRHAVMAYLIEL